jgi:hypothetical protein
MTTAVYPPDLLAADMIAPLRLNASTEPTEEPPNFKTARSLGTEEFVIEKYLHKRRCEA